jgi:hypothetical protein
MQLEIDSFGQDGHWLPQDEEDSCSIGHGSMHGWQIDTSDSDTVSLEHVLQKWIFINFISLDKVFFILRQLFDVF